MTIRTGLRFSCARNTTTKSGKRLHDARLILTKDPKQSLDCHPVVREHFAARASPEGHSRLYEHYKERAPHLPDTPEEMTPLFYAVYHGCKAGRHRETLDEVFQKRIFRGEEKHYLLRTLGANGTALSLLGGFFEEPWSRPAAALPPAHQAWLMSEVGSVLRSNGRLAEAIEPTSKAIEARSLLEEWKNAAINCVNLSEIRLCRGDIPEARTAAQKSVAFADRSPDAVWQTVTRATLADTLHQTGDIAEAEHHFKEAEHLQAEFQPQYSILYSVRGYQ